MLREMLSSQESRMAQMQMRQTQKPTPPRKQAMLVLTREAAEEKPR